MPDVTQQRYLFAITTFDDEDDRAAVPLVLANNALAAGAGIGVCPPCAKTHGVTQENALPGAQWMGASAFLAEMSTRHTVSF